MCPAITSASRSINRLLVVGRSGPADYRAIFIAMITDDASLYLQDFGKTVVIGTASGLGILDAPGDRIIGDMVMAVDYALTVPASLASGVKYGTALTVDGVAFTVKENQPQQDGLFHVLMLEKS